MTVKAHSSYFTVATDRQRTGRELRGGIFAGSGDESNSAVGSYSSFAVGNHAHAENTAMTETGGKENENDSEARFAGENATTRKRAAAYIEGTCFFFQHKN